jgi:hypothetical protein
MIRKIFFHEDSYCQIEISPLKNLNYCERQMNDIDNISEEINIGSGYSEIVVREESLIELKTLQISPNKIDALIENIFPAYDLVETGYSSSRELCPNVKAFGENEEVAIFYSLSEDNWVNNIWLELLISTEHQKEQAIDVLTALSQLDSLLLADWEGSVIVDLSDKISIEMYVNEQLEQMTSQTRD